MYLHRRAALAGLSLLPFSATEAASRWGRSQARTVRRAAETFMKATSAPGLAIGLVTPAGRRVFHFGESHPAIRQPVRADTLFEMGSIGKTLTVALAELAVREGAMAWSDTPGRHVPEVAGPGTDQLTLMHLATHCTGGMPRDLPDAVTDWDKAAAWFRAWSPPGEPGKVRVYANPSIGLLGVVAARAMGGDFATLARTRIMEPLGMTDSLLAVPDDAMARYAEGHRRDGRPVRQTVEPLATEAYGLRATAPDMLRFVEAHLGLVPAPAPLLAALRGNQSGQYRTGPLIQASIWEMYAPPAAPEAARAGVAEAIWARPNPAIWFDTPLPPATGAMMHKTGGTNGFGAYAAFWPGQGKGLVIMANRSHSTEDRLTLAETLRGVMKV